MLELHARKKLASLLSNEDGNDPQSSQQGLAEEGVQGQLGQAVPMVQDAQARGAQAKIQGHFVKPITTVI